MTSKYSCTAVHNSRINLKRLVFLISKVFGFLSILGDGIFRTLERIESNQPYYVTLVSSIQKFYSSYFESQANEVAKLSTIMIFVRFKPINSKISMIMLNAI